MRREVVVTGVGACTPFGRGMGALTTGLREGRSCARPLVGAGWPDTRATGTCPVPAEALEGVEGRAARLSRAHQMAMLAVTEALQGARLDFDGMAGERVAVCYGAPSSTEHTERLQATIVERGPRMVSPLAFENSTAMAGPGTLAIELGIRGPTIPLPGGGASGLQGLYLAAGLLRSGAVDAAIVVATEEIAPLYFRSLDYLGVLSRSPDDPAASSRPFDARRSGIVLGEGATALVLEWGASAVLRGANPLAEVRSTALAHGGRTEPLGRSEGRRASTDSPRTHTNPLERTMRAALTAAEIAPTEVDYIAACANSSRHLDRMEAGAIASLGSGALVSSITSMLGDSGAASGLLNVTACIAAMGRGFVPPSINYSQHELPLGFDLQLTPRAAEIRVAMANAHSLGGACATTVLHSFHPSESQ